MVFTLQKVKCRLTGSLRLCVIPLTFLCLLQPFKLSMRGALDRVWVVWMHKKLRISVISLIKAWSKRIHKNTPGIKDVTGIWLADTLVIIAHFYDLLASKWAQCSKRESPWTRASAMPGNGNNDKLINVVMLVFLIPLSFTFANKLMLFVSDCSSCEMQLTPKYHLISQERVSRSINNVFTLCVNWSAVTGGCVTCSAAWRFEVWSSWVLRNADGWDVLY